MSVFNTIIIITTAIILFLLCYALFANFRLYINTRKNEGKFSVGPLLKGSLRWAPEHLTAYAAIDFPFYHKEWDLMNTLLMASLVLGNRQKNTYDKHLPVKKRKTPFFLSKHLSYRDIQQLFRSFTVQQFSLHIDTDDYCLNAQLFPLFYLWSTTGADTAITFDGNSYCIIDVKNSGINILFYLLIIK